MRKMSSYFRLGLALALVAAIVVVGLSAQGGSSALAAATAAPTTAAATAAATVDVSKVPLCLDPTPTPTEKPSATPKPTKAATSAATVAATAAATTAATAAATAAATTAPTAAATAAATVAATPTAVPPTATTIPVGKKPATAGLVLSYAGVKQSRLGQKCFKVLSVVKGGPADIAGIKTGDLMLRFDKTDLKEAQQFFSDLSKKSSGDVVTLVVQRGKQAMAFTVTLGLNPYAG